jgi:3-deoxy-D-manno-octulosonate 8-phosphate phosphatase (KDO 8-P phosphatase)
MTAVDLLERTRRVRMLSCDVDGVLTDGKLYYADDGSQIKVFSALDGLGLKMLQNAGIVVAWITGSNAPSVAKRARDLAVMHLVMGADDKLSPWHRLRDQFGLAPEQCAHVGDDLPDLAIMTRCGFAATVPHAPQAVKQRAHYVTRADGGAGAVRELCEMILAAQGALAPALQAFET